jgi:hypothetical protein
MATDWTGISTLVATVGNAVSGVADAVRNHSQSLAEASPGATPSQPDVTTPLILGGGLLALVLLARR